MTWSSTSRSSPDQGRAIFESLYVFACGLILLGGANWCSPAVCAEVSSEMRELLRLTGIKPMTLLSCRMLARWSTIVWMLLIMLPVVCLARALGGVTTNELLACAASLLMLTVLTAAMACVAGVSVANSENGAKTATLLTLLLMLLYHSLFWLTSAIASLIDWFIESDFLYGVPSQPWLDFLYDFSIRATPVGVLIRAAQSPDTFSVLSPEYWIHFLAGIWCFRMSAIVMRNRFRSLRSASDDDLVRSQSTGEIRIRPRYTGDLLFWKDAYVLSGGMRAQRRCDWIYAMVAAGVVAIGMFSKNDAAIVVVGILALCVWPGTFAHRTASLLIMEFHQNTWSSLMLLPIDRNQLLVSKCKAVAWLHRAVVIPVLLAIGFAFPRGPWLISIAVLIAPLAAIMLSLVSCLEGLWPRLSSPSILVLAGIGLAAIWYSFGHWIGLGATIAGMGFLIVVTRSVIDYCLTNWDESYLPDTSDKA
jgi:hypothetical protein